MRSPWEPDFPEVFSLMPWQSDREGLPMFPEYFPAKKRRDVRAAWALCNKLCVDHAVLDLMLEHCSGYEAPLLLAPSLSYFERTNVLAIGYAEWLSADFGWDVASGIRQSVSVNRDFNTDGWFRLAHEPEFEGVVDTSRPYVLVDDVFGMGGTIAALRGFIKDKGGHVICATTLAYGWGGKAISLATGTHDRLIDHCNGELAGFVEEELGYGIDCLTEPEGRFLLQCASIDDAREGIAGARDAGTQG